MKLISVRVREILRQRAQLQREYADAPENDVKEVCEAASGCLFEIEQQEVGTIFGEFERGRHYVRLAREAVDSYWRAPESGYNGMY